jgi:nucleoside-diphosphate-sugar epimerase
VRIVVIGPGGFIGPRLSASLKQRSHELFTFSSSDGSFDVESGMLADLPDLPGLDALVYLAQSPFYRDLPERLPHVWSVNVLSAAKAAQWARRNGARRILYASTGNVYSPSFHPHAEADAVSRSDWYALSKVHAEEMLSLFPQVDVNCARLFGVYGPGQRGKLIPNLISAVRDGRNITLLPHPHDSSDAAGLRLSLCYIDDAVRVLVRLIEEGGPRVLNVASPEVLSIREIASTIGQRVGRAPAFTIGSSYRHADLIADTSQVMPIMGSFTNWSAGITNTLVECDDGGG